MNNKKWISIILPLLLISVVGFGCINYLLDPMLQYGTEGRLLKSYEYAEMYSNPGIAKNYDYDSVMVGTSMIENTDVDLCDKLWNVDMIRLPYSGGTSFNMKTILDVAFKHNDSIENVYWELDEFQLFGASDQPRYPLPTYLYDDNRFNDLKYLLNLDIFYHYTLKDIINTLKGHEQNLERRGITLTGDFGADNTLAAYPRIEMKNSILDFEKSSMKVKLENNLSNLCSLIEDYEDVQFSFFMPPFSILYWDNQIRNGSFDATMDGVEYAVKTLLAYDNAQVYFYHGETEVITNLDNYKDYSHYGNWINDTVTQWISEGKGKLSVSNYQKKLHDFRQYISSYNFDSLFY